MSKTTFAPYNANEDEHQRVRTAASIRAARVDDDGNWMSDPAKYHSRCSLRSGITKPFSAFNGHKYRTKLAESVSSLMEEAEKLIRGQPVPNTPTIKRPNNLSTLGSDFISSGKSTPPTKLSVQDLPQIHEIQVIDLHSRSSPRLPQEPDDLICFDDNVYYINYQEGEKPYKMQQISLLDDGPPFEPSALTALPDPMVVSSTLEV